MTFKQCAAHRPDGKQCRRTAQDGLDFCYSHRHNCHMPKAKPRPPTTMERIRYHYFDCVDCGRLVSGSERRINFDHTKLPDVPPGSMLVLCEPCLRLRKQIESRIMEIVDAAPSHTLSSERVYEDLEQFGVERDLVEAARFRMHADGRLVAR